MSEATDPDPAREAGSRHEMPFGANLRAGGVAFRLWAPAQSHVALRVEGEPRARAMQRDAAGWHVLDCADLRAGSRYRFEFADGSVVPDPASRFQPADVHGPSEVVDPLAYRWRDAAWRSRPWNEAVVYELHVGCFTPAGTFRAAIERLGHLAELGVSAIELMPISDFAGRRGWGYDGVLPFAPEARYGRPEDLKALVDAAHAHGLMVLLDVVYNHFGPEGNYTHLYWPELMTRRHETPWGAAVNYDDAGSEQVREFVIHNALYWLEEYHFDGLRLDAVHAIRDEGPRHLLEDLSRRAAVLRPGRMAPYLVLENEENEARWLAPSGPYTAQWNDDVHHGLHVALTHESSGYYAEYCEDPSMLPRALAEGFAFQGETMRYRARPRGMPSAHLPPTAFVAFLQNHDQIGNRARGERIASLAPHEALRAAAAIYLLAPQVPMLFMGEEWGSRQPFLYFCDFAEPLASAVRDGRRAEFARFPEYAGAAALSIPDPTDEATFAASVLDWNALQAPDAQEWLRWYRAVLATRHARIVPLLGASFDAQRRAGTVQRAEWSVHERAFHVRWTFGEHRLSLIANLAATTARGATLRRWLDAIGGESVLWHEGAPREPEALAPWSVSWTMR